MSDPSPGDRPRARPSRVWWGLGAVVGRAAPVVLAERLTDGAARALYRELLARHASAIRLDTTGARAAHFWRLHLHDTTVQEYESAVLRARRDRAGRDAPAVPLPAHVAFGAGDAVWSVLDDAVRHARSGVPDGELSLVVAAVLQAVLATNQEVRRRAWRVAEPPPVPRPSPMPAPPALPAGPFARLDTVTCWVGTHAGPETDARNQDAVAAAAGESALACAVADGVSNSFASAIASRVVARAFCESAVTARSDDDLETRARRALQETVRRLRAEAVEARGSLSEELRDGFTESVAQRQLDRVLAPTNGRPVKNPAMATTLLGCVVRPRTDRVGARACVGVVGDGVIEHVRPTGEVRVVLGLDPDEYAITTALYPGLAEAPPRTRFETVELAPGDRLVLATDGLGRGHHDTVWSTLSRLSGLDLLRDTAHAGAPDLAARALDAAVARVLGAAEAPGARPDFLRDNLSVAIVAIA